MFDTHTHLQFKAFEGKTDEVIKNAQEAGVEKIIVVGTNLESSRKAIELAEGHPGLYATIGLHPHHIFGFQNSEFEISHFISEAESLVKNPLVVAIGETGMDKHLYSKTQYQNYAITDEFLNLQKICFKEQIKLAIKYQKSLIIHNREAVPELLQVLEENWNLFLRGRSVFHCCEPDQRLLAFALKHRIFIGIDGDITYDKEKQEFMKQIPLELLVLETDSPYFVPEPLKRSPREGGDPNINEPKNLKFNAEFISKLRNEPIENVMNLSSRNSSILFKL